jgi:hypothetical protein
MEVPAWELELGLNRWAQQQIPSPPNWRTRLVNSSEEDKRLRWHRGTDKIHEGVSGAQVGVVADLDGCLVRGPLCQGLRCSGTDQSAKLIEPG